MAGTIGDPTHTLGRGRFSFGVQSEFSSRDVRIESTTLLGMRVPSVTHELKVQRHHARVAAGVWDGVDAFVFVGTNKMEDSVGGEFGLSWGGGVRLDLVRLIPALREIKLIGLGAVFQATDGLSHTRANLLGFAPRVHYDLLEAEAAIGASYKGLKGVVPYGGILYSVISTGEFQVEIPGIGEVVPDFRQKRSVGGYFGVKARIAEGLSLSAEGRFLDKASASVLVNYSFSVPEGVGSPRSGPWARGLTATADDLLSDTIGRGRFALGFNGEIIRRDIEMGPVTVLGTAVPRLTDEFSIQRYYGRFTVGLTDWFDGFIIFGANRIKVGRADIKGEPGMLWGGGLRVSLFRNHRLIGVVFSAQTFHSEAEDRMIILGVKSDVEIDLHGADFPLEVSYKGFQRVVPYAGGIASLIFRKVRFDVPGVVEFRRQLKQDHVLGGFAGVRVKVADNVTTRAEVMVIDEPSFSLSVTYRF